MPKPWMALGVGDGWDLVLFFGVLGLTGVLIVVPTVVACQWRAVRVAQAQIQLKREMVQRGMSAGEIERVIRSASVPELVQQGLSAKAINRLLRATAPPGPEEPGGDDRVAAGPARKGAFPDPEL
ncbi:MAG TPA: hypothetical protein VF590_17865 [Isosphaeraceae bacterium]|jgi:hypothetical protein